MRPYLLHIHERPLTLVKFNHDGDFFLTCAKDGEVCLIRTENCERVGTYQPTDGTKAAVFAVDITMDSKYVVTCNADGKLYLFTFDGKQESVLNHGGICKYVEWNQKPGEQNRVVTCNDKFKAGDGPVPNRIMVWQMKPCVKRIMSIEDQGHLPMKATKVKWGPFDETLVSIDVEGMVNIYDAFQARAPLKRFQAHNGEVTSMNFTQDRMLMITSSKDTTAKLWAMDDYECVKVYKTDRPLNDAAISPLYSAEKDPKYHVMLGGGQDAKDVTTTGATSGKFEAVLYHMVYEEEIGTIKGHFGPMNTLAWFTDGAGFVSGGEDGYVRVHHFDNDYFANPKKYG